MTKLRLNLLGGLEVSIASSGQPIAFPRKKAVALLVLLAYPAGREMSRETLADLLWGHTGDRLARNNLRQTFFVLRRVLPDLSGLINSPKSICLIPEHVESDIQEFEAAAIDGSYAALTKAAKLYVGDFLHGFSVRAEGFEQWSTDNARRLREIALSVFERLSIEHLKRAQYDDAIMVANRILEIDPLHEAAHQTVIRAYRAQGRIGLAQRQFEICRKKLAEDLGVEPSLQTQKCLTESLKQIFVPSGKFDNQLLSPLPISGFRASPTIAIIPLKSLQVKSAPFADALTAKLIIAQANALPLTVVDHRTISEVAKKITSSREMAKHVGSRYVVEGSVRLLNRQISVDISVIEVSTGRHIGSGSYRHSYDDLLRVAENLAPQIAGNIAFKIELAERRRVSIELSGKSDAWGSYQRGMALLDKHSVGAIKQARKHFQHAMDLEPNNPHVIAGMARWHLDTGICMIAENREDAYTESLELSRKAYEIDSNDPFVNWTLGKSFQRNRMFDLATEAFQRSLAVVPENPDVNMDMGNLLSFMGMPEKGIPILQKSFKLRECSSVLIARSFLQARVHHAALHWAKRARYDWPDNSWCYVVLGSSLGHMDRPDEAKTVLQACEQFHPGRVVSEFNALPTQYGNPWDHDHILMGVLKAGWQP